MASLKDLLVNGAARIVGKIYSAGGFVGNLTGDVTGDVTGNLTGDVTGNLTGDCSGNAETVTNGVYTTGNQTIAGTKTFSSTISGSISGTAAYATNIGTSSSSLTYSTLADDITSITGGTNQITCKTNAGTSTNITITPQIISGITTTLSDITFSTSDYS